MLLINHTLRMSSITSKKILKNEPEFDIGTPKGIPLGFFQRKSVRF
jgi:hypothetical protein